MKILFKNIKELVQIRDRDVSFISGKEMKILPTIKDAYLSIVDGIIDDYGMMSELSDKNVDEVIDATGKMVLPSWCDSHTHIYTSCLCWQP